MSQITRS